MIFFDTNVLIYNSIEQDKMKGNLSDLLIKEAIDKDDFFISTLVFSEYLFTLAKLKILDECEDKIMLYSKYINSSIGKEDVIDAYNKCKTLNSCRNINDFIHLEIAEKYCEKIVTFDSDFKNLQNLYSVKIDILKEQD